MADGLPIILHVRCYGRRERTTVAHRAQEGADECTRQELFNSSQVIVAGASARPQIRQQKATNVTQFSPTESTEFRSQRVTQWRKFRCGMREPGKFSPSGCS